MGREFGSCATALSHRGEVTTLPRSEATLVIRWTVALDHITRLDVDWAARVDLGSLETLDLRPTDGLRVVINLDVPLGDFGPQIELPYDRGNDYGGNPDRFLLRFAKAL
jgi:hypothetical protein